MMRFLFACLLISLLSACNLALPARNAATAEAVPQAQDALLVAWAQSGNLIVWRQGEDLPRRVASGGAIQPFVAPDGEAVMFTRGANGVPESLWVVDSAGRAEQQLVAANSPRNMPDSLLIGDVGWLSEKIFYFNTLEPGIPSPTPRNDLYRGNLQTREIVRILAPGDGGRFTISPNKDLIAVVSPGTYDRQDGRIRVVDPLKLDDPRDLLFFVGVATGGHNAFYPTLHWLPDSSAIRVAIPDADLVYSDTDDSDNVPPTRIWYLPVNNPSDRELTGSVSSSFFGLPQWSRNGSQMIFARRQPGTNTFDIILADAGGNNEQIYLSGKAGDIALPQWLPATQAFFYRDDTVHYLGAGGETPRSISNEILFSPKFVSNDVFVYATTPEDSDTGIQMRYGNVDGSSQAIGDAGDLVPLFDARVIEGS